MRYVAIIVLIALALVIWNRWRRLR